MLANSSGSGACLTEAGEALVRHGAAVFEQLAAATAELNAIAALKTGRLRIGTFSSAGATILVQALAQFRKRHPGVKLTMIAALPEALVRAVKAAELDLAVIFDYPTIGYTLDDGLEAHHLLDDPAELLVSNKHPLARRRRVTFADLRHEPWLAHTLGAEHPAQKLITACCTAAGFEPNITFEVNDCEMTQALVAAEMGIALLPRLAIHPVHPGVTVKHLDDGYTRRVSAIRLGQAHPHLRRAPRTPA
jgi:DNA-binding transcriptional LysR family regulator